MDQATANKIGVGIKVFGVVLFVVCLGGLIWSLFRSPVTTEPMPEVPVQLP